MVARSFQSLTLSHFRSHKHLRIELDPRPVVLHGPNGAGKTNILEAVSLFSPGRGLRRVAAAEMARRPEALGWKLTGALQTHEVEITAEAGSSREVRVDGKITPQIALAELLRMVWLVPSMDRLWIEAPEGRRRFLDRLALSFFPEHADSSLTFEKAMRERNRLLRDQVRDPHWYDALEAQMARSAMDIQTARVDTIYRIAAAQDHAATAFPAADLGLDAGDLGMPDTEAQYRVALADTRGRDMAAGRTLLGPHRADLRARYTAKDMEAKDCSTGEQKALLISIILANARALARNFDAPPIVLLDEVAAHLDEGRRRALYDEIVALGTQAWMTGTGSELFSGLEGRAQFFDVTDEAGISTVRRHE
ncbi:DNA replication and repair protein RecF [Poseidonocella pacifica]|uniref:DNA replication and repair protein RecF n=1 Tax=Poseidonocella pacifica TaxID=871651 RepID=A0A1I0XZ04_9RHOB|nr:DNA replication/repair protein RecF [Poseidonocella pacifica]SFB05656.1 DNA replication and repair protein RecF [Poseidonocella pacifica]